MSEKEDHETAVRVTLYAMERLRVDGACHFARFEYAAGSVCFADYAKLGVILALMMTREANRAT